MTFFYYNCKPENHVRQNIKYTNFKKGASIFLKTLKQPLLYDNHPQRIKNLPIM